MKKKILYFAVIALVIVGAIFFFSNQNKGINKTIKTNYSHKEKDILNLIDESVKHFDIDGIKLTDVYYDESKSQEYEKNILDENNNYEDCIVIYANFKTSTTNKYNGFNPNSKYTDYELKFIKDGSNQWKLINTGY